MTSSIDLFIDFAAGGNSAAYKRSGWAEEEEAHTWTEGNAAELVLPTSADRRPFEVELAVFPFVHPPLLQKQHLTIEVNGRAVLSAEISAPEELHFELNADQLMGDQPQQLVFRLPNAASPRGLGLSNDPRLLGCGLRWLRCRTLDLSSAESPARIALSKADRRVIAVYGDAQARELAQLVARLPSVERQFSVTWLQPGMIAADSESAWADLGTVAQFWRQLLPGTEEEASRLDALADGSELVTFPRLGMELLWPFDGPDPRRVREDYPYENGRYEFGDTIGASLADTPGNDQQLIREYLRRSAACCPDPSRALEKYAAQLAAAERGSHVKVADFLLGNFQHVKLFHNRHEPSGTTLRALAAAVIEAGAFFGEEDYTAAVEELDGLTQGYQGMFQRQVPVNPVIAERYGLEWYRRDARYRYFFNRWTFDQYIPKYIRWRPWCL